jgi:DEAD/DEAH box helicase domain-containing protein
MGVVSTNALELGVDIGSLELAVLHGYPGSVAAAWQQIGRAGRRSGASAGILVASSSPLDQYLASRPEHFFGSSPERARIDPDNPHILMGHLKCSAFELPFRDAELFGGVPVDEALEFLEREEVLHHAEGRWFWQADSFPAESLSLRSATSENYVITDVTDESRPRVIGHVDRRSAPTLIHPEAIYFHSGTPYQVTELDAQGMRALVKRVETDYYTDGDSSFRLQVLDVFERTGSAGWGEALLATRPTVYKKIRILTHENVGYGHIHLPEEQMHTTACWFSPPATAAWSLWEEERRTIALEGTGHLLRIVAPLFLMCDRSDLVVTTMVRDPFLERPAIYLADNVPGGVGLAEGAWGLRERLIESALEALSSCRCDRGCPGCVGADAAGEGSKDAAAHMLRALLRDLREENRAAEEGRRDGRKDRGSDGPVGAGNPVDPGAGD